MLASLADANIAYDCSDARIKAAKATFQEQIQFKSPERYAPIVPPTSPWKLADVTACEVDDTDESMPADDIVTEDGRRLPIHRAHASQ
jgi:hypothetical protein